MSEPVASVVIAAYNGAHVIGDQLDALANQEDAPAFEVIVVDNNSPDDLRSVCERFVDRLDIRVLPATKHQGQGYARNVGALAARGSVLLLCDQDDIVGAQWVTSLTKAAQGGGVLATGLMEYQLLNPPVTARIGQSLPPQEPFTVQGYLPFAFGSNMGILRRDYLEVGGMDNTLRGGDEDVDFSWRAQERGLDLVVEPKAVVHYRLRTTPRDVFRQQLGYGRTRVLTYVRSLHSERHLAGMSLRWTVQQVMMLPWRRWRLGPDPARRLEYELNAGRLVGNLQAQWRYRVLKQIPAPFTLREMELEGIEGQ